LAEASTARALLTSIKPDYIFHLASHNSGSRDLDLVLPTFRSNLISTVNLLTAACEVGCRRMILAGSLEEPDAARPQDIACSPYAVAKWASSAYARLFHALYQLPVVTLRLFMVYGPSQQDLRKLIPYVILSLLKGEAPELASGQRQVDWIYVEDVVQAFLAAAKAESIDGETIDVGSGRLIPIRTVVEELVRLVNPQIEPCFGALPERPMEQIRVADTTRSRTMIGWKATTCLEDGLKGTVDWYQHQFAGATPLPSSQVATS
jgi:UDP-glucose 4-epimerase